MSRLTSSALTAVLDALGPRVRRAGEIPAEATVRLPTGLPELDALLCGGLPLAQLSEIAGPDSAGRTALALSLLATTTRGGAFAAWVDAADAFDPLSAEGAGAVLTRVLWARPAQLRAAWRATEHLLDARGFALVVLDLAGANANAAETSNDAAWARLARSASAANSALVVLSPARCTGTWSTLALALAPLAARFSGAGCEPRLLDGLDTRVQLARSRSGSERALRMRLAAPAT